MGIQTFWRMRRNSGLLTWKLGNVPEATVKPWIPRSNYCSDLVWVPAGKRELNSSP